MSSKYLTKPTHKNARNTVELPCHQCKSTFWESCGSAERNEKHFCSNTCYGLYKRTGRMVLFTCPAVPETKETDSDIISKEWRDSLAQTVQTLYDANPSREVWLDHLSAWVRSWYLNEKVKSVDTK